MPCVGASVCVSLICLLDWVSVCTFRSARALNSLTLAFFFADWDRMLSNLGSTVPFLGTHGKGKPALSRPGAWAYPDMLEVGRLKNFTESRTHFAAWAVMSSPLILSFDLRVDKVLDDMWPIISNRDVYVHIHTPRHCAAMLRCALH